MNHFNLDLSTLRLALSGALLGIAITSMVYQFPYYDIVGGSVGFFSVLIAKANHFF